MNNKEEDKRTLLMKQIDDALKNRSGIHSKNYGYERENPKQERQKNATQKTLIKKEGKFIVPFH